MSFFWNSWKMHWANEEVNQKRRKQESRLKQESKSAKVTKKETLKVYLSTRATNCQKPPEPTSSEFWNQKLTKPEECLVKKRTAKYATEFCGILTCLKTSPQSSVATDLQTAALIPGTGSQYWREQWVVQIIFWENCDCSFSPICWLPKESSQRICL